MTLQDDLENLYSLRDLEIRNLHRTYLHTKRTVARAVSPQRIVRKRIGLFLGLGALLGVMAAPAPLRAPAPAEGHTHGKRKKGGWLPMGWIKSAVGKISPQAAAFIPEEHAKPTAEPQPESHHTPEKPRKGVLHLVLTEALTLILSRLDFPAIIQQIIHSTQGGGGAGGGAQDEAAHDQPVATVGVADVGTVPMEGVSSR